MADQWTNSTDIDRKVNLVPGKSFTIDARFESFIFVIVLAIVYSN